MIRLRKSQERGHFDHGWLDTYHTFSFGAYRDPRHMGFRSLRVINDDRIDPGMGFGAHGHSNMEIVTYVLSGALQHKDSMGNGGVLRRGDVQRMTAGRGIMHSEFNASSAEPVHLLQIWVEPAEANTDPSYEQRHYADEEKRGRLKTLVSGAGVDGTMPFGQDATISAALLNPGEQVRHALRAGRGAWVHAVAGELRVNGHVLTPGDAAAVEDEAEILIEGSAPDSEVLVFDLA